MAGNTAVKWTKEVAREDFAAGESYLTLLLPPGVASKRISALKKGAVTRFPAKDILRASELPLLDAEDPDVAKQLKKVRKGERLSPLLLIRERGHARLIVADGFHRLCAVHHVDPNAPVACKIA